MATIDLKKTTLYVSDGTVGTLVNQGITYTAVKGRGMRPNPSIEISEGSGTSGALSITVTGDAIAIVLARASSAVTTTAAQLIAALIADTAASALVTPSGAGATPLVALAATSLSGGPKNVELLIGTGNLTYTEKMNLEYIRERGSLDSVREGDEDPVDVSFDFQWEFLTSSTGGTETIEEAIKQTGNAADWVTSAIDTCEPYAVDITIKYAPPCGGIDDEYIVLPYFRRTQLQHDLRAGTVSCTGSCNIKQITPVRVA